MRLHVVFYFFVMVTAANAQNGFDWSENYKLTIEDFLGSGTLVGPGASIYYMQTGSGLNFSYQMTNAEFMMTRNWNEKVTCTFDRSLAYLVAPNDTTAQLLINMAQFDFDLSELYCRKLRKAIFDEKKWTSNASMFMPIYDRINKEFNDLRAKVSKETEIGLKADLLRTYHEDVLSQIRELPDFCRTCKPARKKN